MTPSEKQAFDAMRVALEKLHDGCIGFFDRTNDDMQAARAALAAADAVAEQGQGPQPEFDLTNLITKGAKAWAGVNAQDLREGKPVGEPPAETDAERMAGARAKHDDTYPGDLLARMEDDPR